MNLSFEITDIPVEDLDPAPWNPNTLSTVALRKLRRSVEQFGLVQNLVVRPLGSRYEVLSGNQRLTVLEDLGASTAPCYVVNLEDAPARLLAQALNHLHGEDDLGLRAGLLRQILAELPEREVLAVLPDSLDGLHALTSLGQFDFSDIRSWQTVQEARLHHLTIQLTGDQREVVEAALSRMPSSDEGPSNPNRRGEALFRLCEQFLSQVTTDAEASSIDAPYREVGGSR